MTVRRTEWTRTGGSHSPLERWRSCVVLLALLGLAGCESCREQATLARLTERQGSHVQRDYSKAREQWKPAEVGATFVLGDGMRTLADSTAQLSLADGSSLSVRPSTTIRFVIDGAGEREQAIDLITGEALFRSGANDVLLRTHVGLAVVKSGSELVLTRVGTALMLGVELGSVRFRDSTGQDSEIERGERITLDLGMAIVKPPGADAGPATPDPLPDPNATKAAVLREGIRARDRDSESWRELPAGEYDLAAATHLRLGAGAELQLSRGPERARVLGAGEYVVGEGGVLLSASRGNVRVFASERDVEVRVPGGAIVARAADGGSEAELRIGDKEGWLDVKLGAVTFKSPDGNREVSAGHQYHWAHASRAAEPIEESEPPPNYSNLEIIAGESFVVHAPEVPVAITVDFSRKCERGLVEIAAPKRRSSGEKRANLLFPVGARPYTVRCLDSRGAAGRVAARGTAHVLQDAGTRKLPLRAPTSLVDADGRTYTIYYQNQLPEVRVRWPNAPSGANYQLDVDGKAMSVKAPEYQFQSGSLRDGTHQLTFSAGDRRSRTANVEVRFDNTTATASLSAPSDRSFKPGETVRIEGLTLPAWNVSVRDGTIEKVGADRFQGQVVTSEARPDIAVRLAHARLGTHYYLRRAAGSQ